MDNSNHRADNAGMSSEKELDAPRRRLVALVQSNPNVSLKSLSLDLGRSVTYLQDYLDGSPRELRYEYRQRLAAKLGCSPEELAAAGNKESPEHKLVDKRQQLVALETSGRVTWERDGHRHFEGPRDLPILGHAKAGELGFFIGNGERQGVTMRPEILRGVDSAYAVRVHDESMIDVLFPGNGLFVDPTRPTLPGDLVVIQMMDGQAFVKRLVRRTEKATICRQYNPAAEVRYDPKKIRAVHKIVQISLIDI